MTVTKKITTLALTLVMLMCLIPSTVFAAGRSGWYQEGDRWYYYQADMMLARTWLKWQSNWYYFADDGHMVENGSFYVDFDKKIYVFDKGGALTKKTGWVSRRDAWFYVKKGGVAATGWKKDGGKWYLLCTHKDFQIFPGAMYTHVKKYIDGKTYLFTGSGALVSKAGWVSEKFGSGIVWYYSGKDGVARTGWLRLGKKWYCFDVYGQMYSNITTVIDGTVYSFDKDGVCLNP